MVCPSQHSVPGTWASPELKGPPAPTPACQREKRRAPACDSAKRASVRAQPRPLLGAGKPAEAAGPGQGPRWQPPRVCARPGTARARWERTGKSGARPAGPGGWGAGRSPGSGASASRSSRAAAAAGAGSPWPGCAPPPQRRGPLLCTPRRAPLPAAPLGIARAGAGRSRLRDLLVSGSTPAAAAPETRCSRPRPPPPLKGDSALECPPGGAQARRARAPLHLRVALGLCAHPVKQCSQVPRSRFTPFRGLGRTWAPYASPKGLQICTPQLIDLRRSPQGVSLSLLEL